ncbi:putative death-receptor fusion protein-domain-containing protein [Thamnocephalis sphaerospora]|uniref:Putative death-receptor fusion protein-domain-containing protein n=1 Tax=Thamnocephalis sphaerospora TaxID=78915 RepID=A0A4P9XJ08_9FUNG|nr:putative death-receptor fusion protein-domain-containing protein [Thamnocephalis sphaerospora]|eukprot:RKP05712.1 putative death-receptor fusion protein-domain-containing protein [Thamnocephalis sphaerospora]
MNAAAAALRSYVQQVQCCLALHAAEGATVQLAEKLVECKTVGQQFLTGLARYTKQHRDAPVTADVCGTAEERSAAVHACLDVCALRFVARDVGPVAGVIFATLLSLEIASVDEKNTEAVSHPDCSRLWRYFAPTLISSEGISSSDTAPVAVADFIAARRIFLPLCRGMLVVFSPAMLLTSLPFSITLHANGIDDQPTTLLGLLFALVVGMATDQDSQSRFMAFDATCQWISTAGRVQQILHQDASTPEETFLDARKRERLVSLIWDSWRDPVDAVQHKVKQAFQALLTTLQAQCGRYIPPDEMRAFTDGLVARLMDVDWREKMKYGFLACLVPHVDSCVFSNTEFQESLLVALGETIVSPHALALLVAVIEEQYGRLVAIQGKNVPDWVDAWVPLICRGLLSANANVRKHTSRLVGKVLRINALAFEPLCKEVRCQTQEAGTHDRRTAALLAILKAAKSLSLVVANHELQGLDVVARSAIYHPEEQVRLDALALVCEARRTTEPITQVELDLVACFLRANLGVPGAHFRQDTTAALSKLVRRMHDNATYCHSNASRNDETPFIPGRRFASWLVEHCVCSLYPDAPFARVASVLNVLRLLLDSFFSAEDSSKPHCDGCRAVWQSIVHVLFTPAAVRPLLALMLGSYDASRAAAARCLVRFPSPLPGYATKEDARRLLRWGLAAVSDPKASQSDGGAAILLLVFQKYVRPLGWYFFDDNDDGNNDEGVEKTAELQCKKAELIFLSHLLTMLEDKVTKAQEDLSIASRRHPIHGLLRALSYLYRDVMEQFAGAQDETALWAPMNLRVIQLINSITEVVVCALENPAPEGYVLDSEADGGWPAAGEVDVLRSNDHHYLLAYCWRGVKEASALLEDVISGGVRSIAQQPDCPFMAVEQLIECGDLLKRLLLGLRHRGAFSHVYPHFEATCSALNASDHGMLRRTTQRWLDGLMSEMQSASISITRRSGGIPYAVLALVANDRSGEVLEQAIARLFSVAFSEDAAEGTVKDDDETPRVHSMNSIRILLTDARLGKHVTKYIERGFILAIDGMASRSWPIRNCAVMLLSSLITRTFGVKSAADERDALNGLSGREFFKKYPKLRPFLLEKLEAGQRAGDDQQMLETCLYPSLVVLARLRPSLIDMSEANIGLHSFATAVRLCAHSRIFKIREMAAHALAPLISADQQLHVCAEIAATLYTQNANSAHGQLCQIRSLLRYHGSSACSKGSLTPGAAPSELADVFESLLIAASHTCGPVRLVALRIWRETLFSSTWLDGVGHADETVDQLRRRCVAISWSVLGKQKAELQVAESMCRQEHALLLAIVALDAPRLLPADQRPMAMLQYLLRDYDHSVREAVMERACHNLASWLLTRIAGEETHPGCLHSASRLFISLNLDDVHVEVQLNEQEMTSAWTTVAAIAGKDARLCKRSAVLPVLGLLLAQLCRGAGSHDVDGYSTLARQWMDIVEKSITDEAPIEIRRAALQSLSVFVRASAANANRLKAVASHAAVPIRLALIQLMQDDDDDIREEAQTVAALLDTLPSAAGSILEAFSLLLADQYGGEEGVPNAFMEMILPKSSYRER